MEPRTGTCLALRAQTPVLSLSCCRGNASTASPSGPAPGACWALLCPTVTHRERSQPASLSPPGKLLSGGNVSLPSSYHCQPLPPANRNPLLGDFLLAAACCWQGRAVSSCCAGRTAAACAGSLISVFSWSLLQRKLITAQQLPWRLCQCWEQLIQLLEVAPRAGALLTPGGLGSFCSLSAWQTQLPASVLSRVVLIPFGSGARVGQHRPTPTQMLPSCCPGASMTSAASCCLPSEGELQARMCPLLPSPPGWSSSSCPLTAPRGRSQAGSRAALPQAVPQARQCLVGPSRDISHC